MEAHEIMVGYRNFFRKHVESFFVMFAKFSLHEVNSTERINVMAVA